MMENIYRRVIYCIMGRLNACVSAAKYFALEKRREGRENTKAQVRALSTYSDIAEKNMTSGCLRTRF